MLMATLVILAALLQVVTVAIVDTGINVTHPHFEGVSIDTYDATLGDNPNGIEDRCLHGTAMAGIVHDQNPEAHLLVIQASNDCFLRQDHVANGVDYAVANGAEIILITSGSTYDYPPLRESITRAVESGVLVVISAGNTGNDVPHNIPQPIQRR